MIDIQNAKKEFLNHANKTEIKDQTIETKIGHSLRVAENCKEIATKLNLKEKQINLAELIGLLHDIGRFEQYKIFNKNINSKTINISQKFDHGKVGVEILKKNQYIRKYIKESEYDNIIFKAVNEHNKYELSRNLSKEEELFCKIIKDADKLDIIYETIYIYWQEKYRIEEMEKGKLSPKMLEDFYNGKLADNRNKISETDQIVRFCSFIYDINFKCTFEMLKQNNNINKMVERFNYKILETKQEIQKIKEIANKYVVDKAK